MQEISMTPSELRAAYKLLDAEIREIKFSPDKKFALLQSIIQYQELENDIETYESLLAERRAQFRELQEFTIPEQLHEAGIWGDRFDLPDSWHNGDLPEYIKVSEDLHCSIPQDRQYDCERWLKANGAADKVSRKEVVCIHAGSLKAVVRRALEKSAENPEGSAGMPANGAEERQRIVNLFKVYTYTKAEIKTQKPRNSKKNAEAEQAE